MKLTGTKQRQYNKSGWDYLQNVWDAIIDLCCKNIWCKIGDNDRKFLSSTAICLIECSHAFVWVVVIILPLYGCDTFTPIPRNPTMAMGHRMVAPLQME